MAADDYAVIVGISSYPGLTPLHGPENDAKAFRAWAIAADGGQVPDHEGINIHTIVSSGYTTAAVPGGAGPAAAPDARPWKADIYAAFDKLRNLGKAKGGRTGRRLYMFFAGHGITPENEVDEAALLMANAARGNLSHIPGRSVAKHFHAAAYFDQVVLLMDCCRDAWGSTRLQLPDWDVELAGTRVDRFSGFASQWNQKARETQFELTKGAPEMHGVFTAHLITMLRTGRMTATTLRRLMLGSTKRFAVPATEYTPVFEPDIQDEIVFNEGVPPVKFPVCIRFGSLKESEVLEVREGLFLRSVYRDKPVGSEVTISLEPTNYQARIPFTAREVAFDVPGHDTVSL